MDDLISRQAAIIQLSHNKNGDDDHDVIVQKDIETIKQLPSAQQEPSDAVYRLYKRAYEAGQRNAQAEIIRCKDCEYGEQDEIGRWYCRGLGCQIGDDDGNGFCSDAEKREE